MIRIYLLLLLLLLAFLAVRWFLRTPPEKLAGYTRILVISGIAVILLLLTASGRMNWLFALLGIVFAFIGRFMPLLLRYAPQLQKLWTMFRTNNQNDTHQSGRANSQGHGKISVNEAYEILGLKPGATQEDIILAHRRLMQRNHPDRGGSDYLASRINQAKEILLQR